MESRQIRLQGIPSGIQGFPADVSQVEEFLSLFFEDTKGCPEGGDVEKAEFYQSDVSAVITFVEQNGEILIEYFGNYWVLLWWPKAKWK